MLVAREPPTFLMGERGLKGAQFSLTHLLAFWAHERPIWILLQLLVKTLGAESVAALGQKSRNQITLICELPLAERT